jgi:hypothetical protein
LLEISLVRHAVCRLSSSGFSNDGRFREPSARHEDDDHEDERRELEGEHLVRQPQEVTGQVHRGVHQQDRKDTPVRVVVDPDEDQCMQNIAR